MKYFVIGFNKTATTSFHTLFLQNGIKSQHTEYQWDTDTFDAFSDGGEDQNYLNLDQKYPDAVFILNTRRLDDWLMSRFKHGIAHPFPTPNWAYPPTHKLCIHWINRREHYYKTLLNYFKERPHKLIIVCIDKVNWIRFVCQHLGFQNSTYITENVRQTFQSPQHKGAIGIIKNTFRHLRYTDSESQSNILFQDPVLTAHYLSLYKNNIL